METIGNQSISSFVRGAKQPVAASCTEVRRNKGMLVGSFKELATMVAALQFQNRDFVLMFRGQSGDWRNRSKNTSLKPTIMRPLDSRKVPTNAQLASRFRTLQRAEELLVLNYAASKYPGLERLKRQRILRWSLLQHYEVCKTPLLDVSQSLRIAASFASLSKESEAFIFVLGVPNLSGAVTASAEAGLQVIRLSSVCPPSAMRPHIQEGYLLGEYPDMDGIGQKQHYKHYEIDLARRLIAKFRFDPKIFWPASRDFPRIGREALYPSDDPILAMINDIKHNLEGS